MCLDLNAVWFPVNETWASNLSLGTNCRGERDDRCATKLLEFGDDPYYLLYKWICTVSPSLGLMSPHRVEFRPKIILITLKLNGKSFNVRLFAEELSDRTCNTDVRSCAGKFCRVRMERLFFPDISLLCLLCRQLSIRPLICIKKIGTSKHTHFWCICLITFRRIRCCEDRIPSAAS